MYDHTLHRWKKHFCCYLQAFSTKDISKHHIKDWFKSNGKKRIKMSKKDEYVEFKNYERKIKITAQDLCRFWKCLSTRR